MNATSDRSAATSEFQASHPGDSFGRYEDGIKFGMFQLPPVSTAIDTRYRGFDVSSFGGVLHSSVGDVDLQAGLYGDNGRRRVGINSSVTTMGTQLDLSRVLGDEWILKADAVGPMACARMNVGEDGLSFSVAAVAAAASLTCGTSDPNSNHDGQMTVDLGVGVGLPSLGLHWGDVDGDHYREFGARIYIPLGPAIGIIWDFKFEIAVSDKDFEKAFNAVKNEFVSIGHGIEEITQNLHDDFEDIFESVGDDYFSADMLRDINKVLKQHGIDTVQIEKQCHALARDTAQNFENIAHTVDKGWHDFEHTMRHEFTQAGRDLEYVSDVIEDGAKDLGHDIEKGFKDFGRKLENLFHF